MSSPFGVQHVYKALKTPVGKLTKLSGAGTKSFRSGAYGKGKAPVFGKKRKAAFTAGREESRNV